MAEREGFYVTGLECAFYRRRDSRVDEVLASRCQRLIDEDRYITMNSLV